jgi:hypothetical protein
MPVSSPRRIQVAQQFVRFGFGEHVDESAPFYAPDFITQVLTTTEAQSILTIVQRYNTFFGGTVAGGLERFRGRVHGWQFGRAGSPVLLMSLPYWTHQVEEMPQGAPVGKPVSDEETLALVDELRQVFMNELDAIRFEAVDNTGHLFRAQWG